MRGKEGGLNIGGGGGGRWRIRCGKEVTETGLGKGEGGGGRLRRGDGVRHRVAHELNMTVGGEVAYQV